MRNSGFGIVFFAFAATTAGKTRSRYVSATRGAPAVVFLRHFGLTIQHIFLDQIAGLRARRKGAVSKKD